MQTTRIRILMIVPAALRVAANTFASQFDAAGGAASFAAALCPEEVGPQGAASHYWASAAVTPATAQAIQENLHLFPGAHVWTYDLRAEPSFPVEKLAQLGLTPKTPIVI